MHPSFSFRVSRRLDSLAYIENITDAYSQYFVNNIEHAENNEQYQNYHLFLSLGEVIAGL